MKDKLFFFASYEGLRVRQPQVANTYEPTLATIQSAPAAVQPLLNAFPKPNGKDYGNGTAQFIWRLFRSFLPECRKYSH